MQVYNYALTATQIAALYTEGEGQANTSSALLTEGTSLANGLVGLWTFDGPTISGTTVDDLSGNGNNGTYYGATPTIGKLGQALSFNGSSSYVNMGNVLNMGTNNWTASAWFKTTDTSTYAGIVGKALYGEQIGRWSIAMNDGADNFECITTNDFTGDGIVATTSGTPYQDGEWHLVTCVWDRSGNLTIYIDGVAQNSTDISAYAGDNFSTSDDLYVGSYEDATGLSPDYYFPGSIDDVRVYDRALSASEVWQLYNVGAATINASSVNLQAGSSLSQGLVGLWTFDGPTISGTTVDDLSGQGNTLTNSGATPTIGKLGQAFSFNGSACLYNTEDFADAYLQNDYTISAWVKTGANGNNEEAIFSTYRGYGGENLILGVQLTVFNQQIMSFEDFNAIVSDAFVNDGNWHLVTGVRTVSGLDTLYVDGQQVYQYTGNTGTLSYSSGNYDAEVGATAQCTNSFMNGDIDDVRVYDRALSPSEIQYLYLMGQ